MDLPLREMTLAQRQAFKEWEACAAAAAEEEAARRRKLEGERKAAEEEVRVVYSARLQHCTCLFGLSTTIWACSEIWKW